MGVDLPKMETSTLSLPFSGLTSSTSPLKLLKGPSMMLMLPKFIAGFSGDFVNARGYANFFTGPALLGVPVLVMVWLASRVLPVQKKEQKSPDPSTGRS